MMWRTCFALLCLVATVHSGNYTYYDGFAHITNNQTSPSQTIESCVCKCLLNGCTALTFYNSSGICSLVYDTMITESDVTFNSTAMLLIVKATLADAP